MPLLWYLLTDSGKVNLSKVAHDMGFNVKALEKEIEQMDKSGTEYRDYEPPTDEDHIKEIDKMMRHRPKYRRPPG